MKFASDNKYRLAVNPKGAHVTLKYGDRVHIGTVQSAYYNEVTGGTRLKVDYFNGESWPIDPAWFAVDVLERTYEEAA